MGVRLEKDSLGFVEVDDSKLWGAQTERSLNNFVISHEKMPTELIYAIANVKKACAKANLEFGKLSKDMCEVICEGCDKVINGELDDNFPLLVWQTGSGTQTNMNVNEVVANYAKLIKNVDIHPNDHVNMSQSSNDVFPTAMCVAVVNKSVKKLIPELERLILEFRKLQSKAEGILKTGRTHLQDATPIKFSDEVSGWADSLAFDLEFIKESLEKVRAIAIGGTAVGNGINAPEGFDKVVCKHLNQSMNENFIPATNKFTALASKNQMVFAHSAIKALATDLMKIANDIRLLACGPRCGLGEITIPANEPGSSIMPGKVNPTQCEAVTMSAVQVMGNDVAISVANSQGNFELNVYMPVIIYNFMQSLDLIADCMKSFRENCVSGIEINKDKMKENLEKSLMLATSFNPYIGYEKSAIVAKYAYDNNLTLKEACLEKGFLSEIEIDSILKKATSIA